MSVSSVSLELWRQGEGEREREGEAHAEEAEEGRSKLVQDVVDFDEELVGSVQGPPSLEDGVGNLQDTVVDLGVVGRQA